VNAMTVLLIAVCVTVALCVIAFLDGFLRPGAVRTGERHAYPTVRRAAVLIASKNGEGTIADAVAAAVAQRVDVYVVSDGSTDGTVDAARDAGAVVLDLQQNFGKPAALHRAYYELEIGERYDVVAILDDDVIVEPDFLHEALLTMTPDVAIAVGRNLTSWPDEHRWNALIASRAYAYWSYQLIIRRFQSRFGIMNCISGSNSLYRTEVLDRVLTGHTPYIVDDTYWTLETHRLALGRIVYAPKAKAWLQDPFHFRDWYKQNVRWMWGTFQGIIGHRIGSRANRFHLSYLALIVQWIVYVLGAPVTVVAVARHLEASTLLVLLGGYSLWLTAAAVALRRPRLVLFVVPIIMLDLVYRVIFVHAFVKAIREPTVASCTWSSPTRFAVGSAT